MEIVDAVWLDSIVGGRGNNGGDRTDNGGRNKGGSRSNNKSGSGNYYANNTSADCINGMGVGAALGVFGGLPGVAAGLIGGAITGKCFQDTSKGGGNVGMGKGGNKCGTSSGGSCSW